MPKMTTNNKTKKPSIWAVACGTRPGIYYQWTGGAEEAIRGYSRPPFQGFGSIAAAEAYLHRLGLERISDDGGWISTKSRAPIFFRYSRTSSATDGDHGDHGDHGDGTTTDDWAMHTLTPSPMQPIVSLDPTSSASSIAAPFPLRPRSVNHPTVQSSTTSATATATASATASRGRRTQLPRQSTKMVTPGPRSHKKAKRQHPAANKPSEQPPPPPPQLDPCQQRAIDAARNGQNVFLTGVAGTGKSFVTKLLFDQAVARHGKAGVALCAPTGMAAVSLGMNGQTLHTLAGVKVPQRASDFSTMHSRHNTHKWKGLECLILDEVGMLQADFLDWLDYNVRQLRGRPLDPFGGIQLIFVGDFAQLGPVPGSIRLRSTKKQPYQPHEEGADCFLNIRDCTAFAFQSALWREAHFCHIHLRRVYRQSDRTFVQALQDLREQRSDSILVQQLLKDCATPLDQRPNLHIPDGMLPTCLYTNNRNADSENQQRLSQLPTDGKCFDAVDTVEVEADSADTTTTGAMGGRSNNSSRYLPQKLKNDKFFDQCQATKRLHLKIGAQVMLVQNDPNVDELVNGSRGVVERFGLCPVVRDRPVGDPGGTERLLTPDDQDKFPGRRFDELKFGLTLEFENRHWKIFKYVKYPLVKFWNTTKLITPSTFERTLFRQGTCRRLQLPLRLSWALTIHKAQGCTLDYVSCDLAGCFTSGQAYVALSRAKSMEGLHIQHFRATAVRTDPLVKAFYQALAEEDTMDDFLQDRAGLWWYPILEHPAWQAMFAHACGSRGGRANAEQFRQWVANYAPPDNYQGWKGYDPS